MDRVVITRLLGTDWIEVNTPYDKVFVALLKADIPPRMRYWESDRKVWGIRTSQLDKLNKIIEQVFGTETIVYEDADHLRSLIRKEHELLQQAYYRIRSDHVDIKIS